MQSKYDALIVVANFFQMAPEVEATTFEQPGDHANEMETSLLLHLCPDLVELDQAGDGKRNPFTIAGTDSRRVPTAASPSSHQTNKAPGTDTPSTERGP